MKSATLRLSTCSLAVVALCVAASAFSQDECNVYRWGVPDFDQVREGLVPINGYSACVPTSGADWLAYIANHGYSSVFDGPRDWQSQANYDFVTERIQLLAEYMHVSETGTDLGAYRAIMQGWLDTFAPGKFTVSRFNSHDHVAPTPPQLYFTEGIGGLLVLGFTNYDAVATPAPHYVESHGHVVALTSILHACGGSPTIWIRNPYGCCGGASTTQSTFVTETYDLEPLTGYFSSDPTLLGVERTMWRRLLHGGNGLSLLKDIAFILPTFGLSEGPHFGEIRFTPSLGLNNFNVAAAPRPVDYDLPGRVPVLALAQEPAQPSAIVLGGESGDPATLWRLNLYDGKFQQLARYPQVGPMTFGPRGELYLYSDGALLRLDPSTTPPTLQGAIRGIAGPAAMTYDDVNDRLLFLTGDRARIGVAEGGDLENTSFEDAVQTARDALSQGHVSMSVSPTDGVLWVADDDADTLFRLSLNAAGEWEIAETAADPSIVAPRNLQVTSRDTLVFTSDGILFELAKDPRSAGWGQVFDVPFAGEWVGDPFVLSRPWSVPGDVSVPREENIVPPPGDGQPVSATDLNGDGVTDNRDFAAFVRFVARDRADGTAYADFNGDGVTDVKDLRLFHTAATTPDKPEKIKAGPVKWTGDEFQVGFAAKVGTARAGTSAGFTIATQLWVVQGGQIVMLPQATYPVVERPGGARSGGGLVGLVPQTIPWDREGGSFTGVASVMAFAELRNPAGVVIAKTEYDEPAVDFGGGGD
jgi:Dockerin type I domain